MHTGIDLRGETGEPVHATAAGKVTIAGREGGYGNMVEIDHGNGLATRYGHLSEIDVKVGQTVRIGEVIGKIGSTGRSTGPHLHYETRINGEAVDPQKFLRAGLQARQRLAALAIRPAVYDESLNDCTGDAAACGLGHAIHGSARPGFTSHCRCSKSSTASRHIHRADSRFARDRIAAIKDKIDARRDRLSRRRLGRRHPQFRRRAGRGRRAMARG